MIRVPRPVRRAVHALQSLPPDDGVRLAARARAHRAAQAAVDYPAWFLRRWHCLPEGYLSRRSVAAYDHVVRPLYNGGAEARIRQAVAAALRPARSAAILDIGCGSGRLLASLAAAFPDATLTGVDLSPFMVERARDHTAGRARILHADATALPFATETFEAVVASHVAGHVPPGTAAALLGEARRVLRPGGRLVLLEHYWHEIALPGWRPLATQDRIARVLRLMVLEPGQTGA